MGRMFSAAEPLESFFSSYFEPLRLRSRSKDTRRLYRTTLRNFAKFLDRPATLADLTDETVSRFLSWFRDLPRSPETVNKERANLLCLWRAAARKRFVEDFPDVAPEPTPEHIPQAWTQEQLGRLFAAAGAEPGIVGGVLARCWWRALLLCLWDSGERIGAIRDIEWDEVDLDGAWLLVKAENRKRKTRDRLYRLAPDTVAALRVLYHPQRQHVFPWDGDRNKIWTRYAKILERAGLPSDRKSKFQRMRRSVASHAESRGGNATSLLDHSKRSITTAYYLDPRIVPQVYAADLLFRPEV